MKDDSTEPLSPECELALMETLLLYKPAGINKHFNMALAVERLSSSSSSQLTSEQVWARLRGMFDLAAVDDREEVIPFPLEEKEFTLHRKEFGGLVTEKAREILRSERLQGKGQKVVRVGQDLSTQGQPQPESTAAATPGGRGRGGAEQGKAASPGQGERAERGQGTKRGGRQSTAGTPKRQRK